MSDPYHFRLIARALGEIDTADAELSLEALSSRMGMSAAHFQRLFSQWVGISPKRYQQYLGLEQARKLLSERHSTLATAHQIGLSGSGRLHDMFLTWEAMSPGDYAKGGAGLQIRWAGLETPFGPAIIMATDRGICAIGFAHDIGQSACFADLARRWPKADFIEDTAYIAPLATKAFEGKARLHLMGAPFQIKVWEALLQVPSGEVCTYSDLAEVVGNPRAQRAVGTAVGRNPISYLIPCHRALRRDGALGGYHWGLATKRAMLAYEAARYDHAKM